MYLTMTSLLGSSQFVVLCTDVFAELGRLDKYLKRRKEAHAVYWPIAVGRKCPTFRGSIRRVFMVCLIVCLMPTFKELFGNPLKNHGKDLASPLVFVLLKAFSIVSGIRPSASIRMEH
jgi:hypothetical protein